MLLRNHWHCICSPPRFFKQYVSRLDAEGRSGPFNEWYVTLEFGQFFFTMQVYYAYDLSPVPSAQAKRLYILVKTRRFF
jgi:hypothetical protein